MFGTYWCILMADFKNLFMALDRNIMEKLGDDVTVVAASTTETVRGVLRLEIEDEELLNRYEVDIVTLEILEDDLHLFNRDTISTFDGISYKYEGDMPKGVGRHLIVMSEII